MQKQIIKSSVILSIIIFFHHAMANDLVILKHEFGRRGWINGHYENAEIYPLSKPSVTSSISILENKEAKSINKVSLDLSVKVKNNDVLATIKFQNRSDESYFIIKNHLPNDYLILPSDTETPISSIFCGLVFNVTTNDVKLFFFGNTCGYPGDLDHDEWLEIPARKGFSFTIRMNDYIYFLPGEKAYNIESSNFFIVTEKWFIQKSINEKLFNIFTPYSHECQQRNGIHYIYHENEICESDYISDELESFMQRFNFNGENESYSFKIRTDEVSVVINGDHLHSLYDKS